MRGLASKYTELVALALVIFSASAIAFEGESSESTSKLWLAQIKATTDCQKQLYNNLFRA